MLIAEDLLLLLTDDETGKRSGTTTEVDLALGGAMLLDLALAGRADVAGPGEDVRAGRLVVRDDTPTEDPLLDEALATVEDKQGKRPRDVVRTLSKKLRPRLYDRLVERGVLREEKGRALGIFPVDRWPAEQAEHERELRDRLRAALRTGLATDPRTGALVALLSALKAVPKVMDPDEVGLTKRELKDNAKRIAEGEWASAAVRKAIDSMNAAMVAVIAAGAATSAGGS